MPPAVAPRAPFDVATVRAQFDRRAARLAGHDALLREVERRLAERLDPVRLAPARIVDLGCGAGHSQAMLRTRFAQAQWLGVDASAAMLARGRPSGWRHWFGAGGSLRVQADAGALPLADASVDLLFSNLLLHWQPQPQAVLAECRRVLRVGGLLLFSSLGPDTLRELRAAFAHWPRARPLPFVDMHDYGDMLVAAGFAEPVLDSEQLTLTYDSPRALLREAGALGGNPRADRPVGLPGTATARRVQAALAAQGGADGRLPLTFEVVYGHAWKPAPRERGVAVVPLERLRAGRAADG
jgi:malonyl-CoA O-methyltransferase